MYVYIYSFAYAGVLHAYVGALYTSVCVCLQSMLENILIAIGRFVGGGNWKPLLYDVGVFRYLSLECIWERVCVRVGYECI